LFKTLEFVTSTKKYNCGFLRLQQTLHSLLHLPDTLNPVALS